MNGIVSVFCDSRSEPLLIGSTKSNMGHPEPASGLSALAKVRVKECSEDSVVIHMFWVNVCLPILNVFNGRWDEKPAILI